MTQFQMQRYVFTSAKLALGLLIASTVCLATAWAACGPGQCGNSPDKPQQPSKPRWICMKKSPYTCVDTWQSPKLPSNYHETQPSYTEPSPDVRTGGCGFVSGGPIDHTQSGGSIQQTTRGYLSPEQTLKIRQIVNTCLIVTKTDRMPTAVHIAEAQIRPGCQNYIRYTERGNVGLGALNLGNNEVLQMRITTRDGRDGDENEIEFAENGKIIASHGQTDDSIENGLALLKTLFN